MKDEISKLEIIRLLILAYLVEKTGIVWEVELEKVHLDFCYVAKCGLFQVCEPLPELQLYDMDITYEIDVMDVAAKGALRICEYAKKRGII